MSVRACVHGFGTFLYGLFLVRFVVLLAAVPALLGYSGAFWLPRMAYGLLVLDRWYQLFNVSWMCLLIASFVLISFQVIYLNAPDRYQSSFVWNRPVSPRPWCWRWLLLFLIGMPLPCFCLACTVLDLKQAGDNVWPFRTACYLSLSILGGITFALIVLYLMTGLQMLVIRPDAQLFHLLPCEKWPGMPALKAVRVRQFDGWITKLAIFLEPWCRGYTFAPIVNGKRGQLVLAPGHLQAALWFILALAGYGFNYLRSLSPRSLPGEGDCFPAIFYILTLILLIGAFLPGLSFFFDRYRVPVVPTLLLMGWLLSRTNDHFFEIPEAANGTAIVSSPTLSEAIDARYATPTPTVRSNAAPFNVDSSRIDPSPDDKHGRTLVVVAAAGGGIQAAAWTARVLTGLDEIYGDRFTRSVGLVSSVSGGSVGTMYYVLLGKWSAKDRRAFTPGDRQTVNRLSSMSCLEAAGWGLAYPDAMRVIISAAVPSTVDRGWAVETLWRRQFGANGSENLDAKTGLDDTRLASWAVPMKAGEMPVVIFNSTIAETGQRLLISPVLSGDTSPDFCEIYGKRGPQLRIATAARLSATFPYVTPMSRPETGQIENGPYSHAADGGYVDNEGIVSVVHAVNFILKYYADKFASEQTVHEGSVKPNKAARPFKRILIVRIQPFPPGKAIDLKSGTGKTDGLQSGNGWEMSVLGPILAMLAVRDSSQVERNDTALELLSEIWNNNRRDDAAVPDSSETPEKSGMRALRAERSSLTVRSILAKQKRSQAEQLKSATVEMDKEISDDLNSKAKTFSDRREDLQVVWTDFVYDQGDNKDVIPLSWKLTKREKENVERAWANVINPENAQRVGPLKESPLKTIDSYFERAISSKK